MHPAILYPRRNQGRPQSVVQQRTTIVRDRGSAQGAPPGTLYALSAICPLSAFGPRTRKRALYKVRFYCPRRLKPALYGVRYLSAHPKGCALRRQRTCA